MPKKFIGYLVAVAVVVGGASFYCGMKYEASKTPAGGGQLGAGTGGGAAGQFASRRSGGRTGGGFVNGTIIAKDSQTITVSIPNGNGTKIVFYSPSTVIGEMVTGTPSDLAVGKNVMVGGSANSDGTLTAETIQIRSTSSTPGFGGAGRPPAGN